MYFKALCFLFICSKFKVHAFFNTLQNNFNRWLNDEISPQQIWSDSAIVDWIENSSTGHDVIDDWIDYITGQNRHEIDEENEFNHDIQCLYGDKLNQISKTVKERGLSENLYNQRVFANDYNVKKVDKTEFQRKSQNWSKIELENVIRNWGFNPWANVSIIERQVDPLAAFNIVKIYPYNHWDTIQEKIPYLEIYQDLTVEIEAIDDGGAYEYYGYENEDHSTLTWKTFNLKCEPTCVYTPEKVMNIIEKNEAFYFYCAEVSRFVISTRHAMKIHIWFNPNYETFNDYRKNVIKYHGRNDDIQLGYHNYL